MPALPPPELPVSGAQHRIGHDEQRVVITEVGGTLREYLVGGVPVVDGFTEDEMCPSARGQVLAPWPNRLAGGRYCFDGKEAHAALDEPARGNAVHGLMRWLPWQLQAQAQNVLVMACMLHPQPGYPWRLAMEIEYRLGRRGLSVTTRASNLSDTRAPFGVGFHPYLTVGTPTIDTARLRFRAARRLVTDERGLPTGSSPVTGSDFDFSTGRLVGSTRLDTAFTSLERDDEGNARIELHNPGAGRRATVWMDEQFPYVMVFTADTVAPLRRRGSIAVEPMSCPPDAFHGGAEVPAIEPGASWTGRWGIEPL